MAASPTRLPAFPRAAPSRGRIGSGVEIVIVMAAEMAMARVRGTWSHAV